MDKTIKILIIVLLSILIVGSLGAFTILFTTNGNFEMYKTSKVYDNDITEEFNAINVDTDSLDVRIIKSNDEKVNVKVYDKKDNKVSIEVENNTLNIEETVKDSICFMCGKREAIISVPEKEYDLVVQSTSGDVESRINLNNATIIVTSGDTELRKVNDLSMIVTSGDIDVEEVNNVTIVSTSGDVEIGKINSRLDIQTISGDIDIDDLTITEDSKIEVISGDVIINKTSNNFYCDAKATSGDVKVKDNDRRSEYELKIRTKSGDIIVR